MKILADTVARCSKHVVIAAGLGLVMASTGASANILALNFDNGKGTLNPACIGSVSAASCYVNPSDPGSTWSDAPGYQTSTLKAYGKGDIGGSGTTLKDRTRLTHDYDGNGRKDATDTNKITETLKTLTYDNEVLSVTNKASITGNDGLFSYTTDVEINPVGGSSPWVTVADFTNDGTELIDLATFPGLDLTDGEEFATRIVTTADYDYSGIDCIDRCESVFRDLVTADFVPEPSSMSMAVIGFGMIALFFAQRRRLERGSLAKEKVTRVT
jgi:hypothetical protein